MFVCVARLTLQIPESGSLKAKRQVLRRSALHPDPGMALLSCRNEGF